MIYEIISNFNIMQIKHLDKNSIKHFGVCFLLSLLGSYGVAFALGASVTKEWKDSKEKNNHWCWVDLTVDVIGCICGYLVHWLFFRYIL